MPFNSIFQRYYRQEKNFFTYSKPWSIRAESPETIVPACRQGREGDDFNCPV